MSTPPITNNAESRSQALKSLQTAVYDKAKTWAGTSILLQMFLFVSGICAIFIPKLTLSYPVFALPLGLVTALVAVRAGKYKSIAESIKREHEHFEGFGKLPSGPRIANLKMDFPDSLRPELDIFLREGITYASDKPPGAIRALENLSESSWYSQHLAGFCVRMLGWLFFGTLAVAIWLLVICAITLGGTSAGIAGAKCVAATLLFVISVGLYRHWSGYITFSQRAGQADAEARKMLANPDPNLCEAHRLLTEYQVARASAPLVPTWVWKIRKTALNDAWALHKSSD